MSSFFIVLFIGISLSMDAFSLALIYGMIIERRNDKIILASMIGIYHFIMPIIGVLFGNIINHIFYINLTMVASIILIIIGINLIINNEKDDKVITINLLGFILLGFSVSIDSFTLGIGLKAITSNYIGSAFIFAICSFLFTYIGLTAGSILGKSLGIYSRLVGGIVLIIIAIMMFMQ